jgi:ribonuclease HI
VNTLYNNEIDFCQAKTFRLVGLYRLMQRGQGSLKFGRALLAAWALLLGCGTLYPMTYKSLLDAVSQRRRARPTAVDDLTPLPLPLVTHGWCDGSCSPNPGPMGVGYSLKVWNDSFTPMAWAGGQIGHGTNNKAEYYSLILMMRHALRLGLWSLRVHMDSQLVVKQMNLAWKVSQPGLKALHEEARTLAGLFYYFNIEHIGRASNEEADELSRRIIYSEPSITNTDPKKAGGKRNQKLRSWQAAAIRVWGTRSKDAAGPASLARIFGVTDPVVVSIIDAKSYQEADFSAFPRMQDYVLPEAGEKAQELPQFEVPNEELRNDHRGEPGGSGLSEGPTGST